MTRTGMERTSLTFSGWLIDNAARLKERLSLQGILDEDAFQDAYIAIVTSVEQESTSDYEKTFLKAYRQLYKRNMGESFTTSHPDELFFNMLSSDEAEPMEETEDAADTAPLANRLISHIRKSFPPKDVMAFEMKMKGLSLRDISDALGIGTTAARNAIERITEMTRERFATGKFKKTKDNETK